MIVRQQGDPLRDLRVLDALDVGFYQDRAEALPLVLLEDGEGVDADRAAGFLMAFWFWRAWFGGSGWPAFPILGDSH